MPSTPTAILLVALAMTAYDARAEDGTPGDAPVSRITKVLTESVRCRDKSTGVVTSVPAAELVGRPVYEMAGNGSHDVGLEDGRRCWIEGSMVEVVEQASAASGKPHPARKQNSCAGTRALGGGCVQ